VIDDGSMIYKMPLALLAKPLNLYYYLVSKTFTFFSTIYLRLFLELKFFLKKFYSFFRDP